MRPCERRGVAVLRHCFLGLVIRAPPAIRRPQGEAEQLGGVLHQAHHKEARELCRDQEGQQGASDLKVCDEHLRAADESKHIKWETRQKPTKPSTGSCPWEG